MKKLDRAQIILDHVRSLDRTEGRWESLPLGDRMVKVRMVDHADGWSALITLPESGVLETGGLPNVLDLDVEGAGKVLSIEYDDSEMRLISMKPGPWETHFGLPLRDYQPSELKKMKRSRLC